MNQRRLSQTADKYNKKPVRIGIDARALVQATARGTAKSAANLYAALMAQAPDWEFRFYFEPKPDMQFPWRSCPANAAFVPLSMPGHRWNLWEQGRLPWQIWHDRVDLLHCPAQTGPTWMPVPTALTIHDLIPLRFDDGWSGREIRRFRRNIGRSLRQAAVILTISNQSHRDLLELFPVSRERRIERLSWAPDPSCQVLDDGSQIKRVCDRYRVRPRHFLFALGAASPRKNTDGLLEAFVAAARDERFQLDLLVVGLQATALARFRPLVDHLPNSIQARIRLYGYIPDEHMVALYNGARTFIFPSFYEGFGLPLLDAMACGCPVLASRRTSIPEVAGEAALYFEPDRIDEMAAAILTITSDKDLEEQMRQAGLARAAKFSWSEIATRLHAVFQDVVCAKLPLRGTP